ncbi:hypothetical protein LSTR_LSTR002071 [Laodelphax striatellus]|uniref:BTB domain-containing protein n=1 Tax=Laodelphax striatellus TaxID=195883 RepID=A0A482XPD8_LAOST|nr:hypothetical protein LSTR_LSTR002071 [Laodelphax striatellus]
MSLITPPSEGEKPFNERFKLLFDDDVTSDCEFVVGLRDPTTIKGHRLIFSLASEKFKGLLKEESVIRIDDLEPEEFQGMKLFIYTGKVIFVSAIKTLLMYIAAQKFDIIELCRQCIKHIMTETTPFEVLEFYEHCQSRNISEFDETCCRIIQEKTDDVFKSEYFSSAKIETVNMILELPSMKLASELELFDYFEKWAMAEATRKQLGVEEMGSVFNSLKKHIRFLTMSWEVFASKPAKSSFLTEHEKKLIGLNIMNLGSSPYPEHLSIVQQPRDFKTFNVDAKKISNTFSIFFGSGSVNSPSLQCSAFIFNAFNYDWCIKLFQISGNLCFLVKPTNLTSYTYLFSFRSELNVLARKESDNLLIENTCSCAYTRSTYNNTKNQFGMLFAVIPLKKLKSNCFLRGNKVYIEGTFIIEHIKG